MRTLIESGLAYDSHQQKSANDLGTAFQKLELNGPVNDNEIDLSNIFC